MSVRDRPAYGWMVLSTFTLNYAVVVIVFMTLGLLLPDISEELDLSPSQQGWLASSLLFGNLIFELPFNWWLSRYRPWRVSSVGFFAAALMILLHGWSPVFAVLLVARVGLGLFYLSTQPPRTLVILQWIPRQQIGLANGVMFGVMGFLEGVGFIVVPLILVWLGDWRATLYVWTGVCLVATGLWFVIGGDRVTPEYEERMQSQTETPLGSIFKYKEPWLMGLGVAGTIGGRLAFDSFWPTFTGEEYGTAIRMTGLIVGVISIAGAPAMLAVTGLPFLARHKSPVMIACGIGLTASYVGMLLTGSIPILFLLGIVNGLSFSFFPLMITSLYHLPDIRPREVAVAVALIYTLMWGGATVGPLTVGFIQEATDNLKLALLVTSVGPLALSAAGVALLGGGRGTTEASIAAPAAAR